MEIIKKTYPSRYVASVEDLAAHYRWQNLDKQQAWGQFIKDRVLNPELDFVPFTKIFNQAQPKELIETEVVSFFPTHYDALRKQFCQIEHNDVGVYEILWEDGSSGSNPPTYPPDKERYLTFER